MKVANDEASKHEFFKRDSLLNFCCIDMVVLDAVVAVFLFYRFVSDFIMRNNYLSDGAYF